MRNINIEYWSEDEEKKKKAAEKRAGGEIKTDFLEFFRDKAKKTGGMVMGEVVREAHAKGEQEKKARTEEEKKKEEARRKEKERKKEEEARKREEEKKQKEELEGWIDNFWKGFEFNLKREEALATAEKEAEERKFDEQGVEISNELAQRFEEAKKKKKQEEWDAILNEVLKGIEANANGGIEGYDLDVSDALGAKKKLPQTERIRKVEMDEIGDAPRAKKKVPQTERIQKIGMDEIGEMSDGELDELLNLYIGQGERK